MTVINTYIRHLNFPFMELRPGVAPPPSNFAQQVLSVGTKTSETLSWISLARKINNAC